MIVVNRVCLGMRPQAGDYHPFYEGYIQRATHLDILDSLAWSGNEVVNFLREIPIEKSDYAYEDKKWTVTEVVGHMLDVERVMAYRALRFSRNDGTPLEGFDENLYVPESNMREVPLAGLSAQFDRLRRTTQDLYATFNQDMLQRGGEANGSRSTVLAIGYIICGHALHHCEVLRSRYLD